MKLYCVLWKIKSASITILESDDKKQPLRQFIHHRETQEVGENAGNI